MLLQVDHSTADICIYLYLHDFSFKGSKNKNIPNSSAFFLGGQLFLFFSSMTSIHHAPHPEKIWGKSLWPLRLQRRLQRMEDEDCGGTFHQDQKSSCFFWFVLFGCFWGRNGWTKNWEDGRFLGWVRLYTYNRRINSTAYFRMICDLDLLVAQIFLFFPHVSVASHVFCKKTCAEFLRPIIFGLPPEVHGCLDWPNWGGVSPRKPGAARRPSEHVKLSWRRVEGGWAVFLCGCCVEVWRFLLLYSRWMQICWGSKSTCLCYHGVGLFYAKQWCHRVARFPHHKKHTTLRGFTPPKKTCPPKKKFKRKFHLPANIFQGIC